VSRLVATLASTDAVAVVVAVVVGDSTLVTGVPIIIATAAAAIGCFLPIPSSIDEPGEPGVEDVAVATEDTDAVSS